jgi:hypothetical protein
MAQKLYLTPKSKLGKWSIVFAIAMPIFFIIGMSLVGFYEGVSAGSTIPKDIIARPLLALSMLAGFICGIFAFFTGLFSIVKKKDYSILVFISTLIGFLDILWILAHIV